MAVTAPLFSLLNKKSSPTPVATDTGLYQGAVRPGENVATFRQYGSPLQSVPSVSSGTGTSNTAHGGGGKNIPGVSQAQDLPFLNVNTPTTTIPGSPYDKVRSGGASRMSLDPYAASRATWTELQKKTFLSPSGRPYAAYNKELKAYVTSDGKIIPTLEDYGAARRRPKKDYGTNVPVGYEKAPLVTTTQPYEIYEATPGAVSQVSSGTFKETGLQIPVTTQETQPTTSEETGEFFGLGLNLPLQTGY